MNFVQLLSLTALVISSASAFAGKYSEEYPVVISDFGGGAGRADGAMWHARSSDNDIERLGCLAYAQDLGESVWEYGVCFAEDALGNSGRCSTDKPGMINAIHALGEFGRLAFEWDSEGTCTVIRYTKSSGWLPAFKEK